jgi:hypothetical protein
MLVIPANAAALKTEILKLAHDANQHNGMVRTRSNIAFAKLTWRSIGGDVARYCQTCVKCLLNKSTSVQNQHGTLAPELPTHPWHTITMDFMGPLGGKGVEFPYLLVMTDNFTRYTELRACRRNDADTVIDALKEAVLHRHGRPVCIHSDNGSHFTAQKLADFTKSCGIVHRFAAVTRPHSVGLVERANRVIGEALRISAAKDYAHWHERLAELQWYLNSATNSSIGFSPYAALYGFPPRTALSALTGAVAPTIKSIEDLHDLMQSVRANVWVNSMDASDRNKDRLDAGRKVRNLNVGDKVLIHFPDTDFKLQARWRGPFTVEKKFTSNLYQVRDPIMEQLSKVHISRIRKVDLTRASESEILRELLPEGCLLVEAVLAHRVQPRKPKGRRDGPPLVELRIRWDGLDETEDSWEPLRNVQRIDVVQAYCVKHKIKLHALLAELREVSITH